MSDQYKYMQHIDFYTGTVFCMWAAPSMAH